MRLLHAFETAIGNLKRNRVRTALSLLGMVIGVFSVTVILSLGIAVKSAIVGYVEGFVGTDFMSINPSVPGASEGNSMQALMMGATMQSIDYADLQALAEPKNLPHAVAVNGVVSAQEFVAYGNKDYRSTLVGTSASYPIINPIIEVAEGRYLSDSDDRSMAPVIVLGEKLADKLFGDVDPLGKNVKVRGLPTQVIGVLKPAGSVMNIDMDTMGFLPLRFVQKRLLGSDYVMEVHVKVSGAERMDATVFDVERLLRQRHRISDASKDDFIITTAKEVTDRLNSITDVITWFLGFLAAISLLVGGIGIMNIMLVSVTERIREVGLRKALGAKNRDIMWQFLSESVVLTTLGGLIGGGFGFLLTLIIIAVMNYMKIEVPYLVSVTAFLGAALVSAVTGIVFGLRPAQKAAELDPIVSLRYE